MSLSAQKRERLPQAPRAPLPELAEFLALLRVHFTQGPSAEAKTELVRDQYQGCGWDGFHRHAIAVMLSFGFSGVAGKVGAGAMPDVRTAAGRISPMLGLPLPELHRRVSEWLRRAAIRELIEFELIDLYCSRKLQL